MSTVKTSVRAQNQTAWKLKWRTVPRGPEGVVQVQVNEGEWQEVHWRKDSDGIWLVLKDGIYGFDLQRQQDDEGRFSYSVSQRGSHQAWTEIVPAYGDEIASSS